MIRPCIVRAQTFACLVLAIPSGCTSDVGGSEMSGTSGMSGAQSEDEGEDEQSSASDGGSSTVCPPSPEASGDPRRALELEWSRDDVVSARDSQVFLAASEDGPIVVVGSAAVGSAGGLWAAAYDSEGGGAVAKDGAHGLAIVRPGRRV